MASTTQPTISTTLSLSSQIYVEQQTTLTITLNLTAPAPITIFTWPGIFNPQLALRRRNFTLHDMSTKPPTPIHLEITKGPKRPGFSRRKNNSDEKYYVTLYPGVDLEIQYPFLIMHRNMPGTGLPRFQVGHRYRFGITDEGKVKSWWWGTRDDVLLDDDDEPYDDDEAARGESPIDIRAEPIEFVVKEA
ncbi:hypothetical protein KCU95_g11873, partial [Aureobasidium melanogenum]